MSDLLFFTKCDHIVTNYEMPMFEENGHIYGIFPCVPIQDKTKIFIRSYSDEMDFIHNLENYTVAPYNLKSKSYNGVSGATSRIGINSYGFVTNTKIRFIDAEINIDPNKVPRERYLVDFVANPTYCPRCKGSGIVKDLHVTTTGNYGYVSGVLKVRQQVLKCLITPLGSSPYDITFGSELGNLIGNPVCGEFRIVLQKTIQNAINNLIKSQPNDLPSNERIVALSGLTIDVQQDGNVELDVSVTNEDGTLIDTKVCFDLTK